MRENICSRVPRILGIATAVLLLTVPGLSAQNGTITGRVLDAESQQPVAAAQVFIEALNLGVLTRGNGAYLLLNVPPGTHTVTVQRIGFRDGTAEVTVAAGGTATQDFRVYEEALQLDAVVVTGTVGQQTRRAIGNSVTSVDASSISETVPLQSMQEMLSGRAPGLQFSRIDGNLGGGSPINIRGFSSITLGNQPLIYIDGVRVDNSYDNGPNNYIMDVAGGVFRRDSGGSFGSALDELDPNTVESIEVIKGPAAATLYGSEASAGVIQIITKKGIAGAPEFDLTVRQGQNWMMNPVGTLGEQWGCAAGDRQVTAPYNNITGICPEASLFTFNIYEYHQDQGRDLFQNGHTQGYNLGIRGGTDQVRYFVSGDWSDDTGIVDYNYVERLALRTNVDVLFSDNLTVSFNAGFTDGYTSYAQQSQLDGGMWSEVLFAQGDQLVGQQENVDNGGAALPSFGPPVGEVDGFYERDPRWYELIESTRDYSRFTASVTGQHTLGEWFTQRFVFGLDRNWDRERYYSPVCPSGPTSQYPFRVHCDGRVRESDGVGERLSFDYNASATYQLNEMLSFTTSAGAQYNADDSRTFAANGDGLPSSFFTSIDQVSDPDPATYDERQSRSLGFFLQETVGLNDRLFVTGAVRADDNSGFGRDAELLYYPKVSVSWVLSEEPFFTVPLFEEVRLRGAFGRSGRAPSAFARTFQYAEAVGPGGVPAIQLASAGNPNVTPEVSSELEMGVDFAMLDQRISGEFTWFHQWVRDALVAESLTPSQAFTGNIQANIGGLNNWGWETALDLRLVQTPQLAFDLRLSASHTDNIITELSDEQEDDNFVEGYYFPNVTYARLDSVQLLTVGLCPGAGCPAGAFADPRNPFDGTNDWYLPWCDLGGDGAPKYDDGRTYGLYPGGVSVPCDSVDTADQELMAGRAYPNYTWQVAPTFRFLNNTLELHALAEGQYGRHIFDVDAQNRSGQGIVGANRQNARVGLTLDDPMMWAAHYVRSIDDERWQGRFDSAFWKLREVGVRYQLPRSLVQRVGVDRASVSLSGRHLWEIWRRQHTDLSGAQISEAENTNAYSAEPNYTVEQLPGLSSWAFTLRVSF